MNKLLADLPAADLDSLLRLFQHGTPEGAKDILIDVLNYAYVCGQLAGNNALLEGALRTLGGVTHESDQR